MDSQSQEKIIELFTHLSLFESFTAAEIKEKFFNKGLAKINSYAAGEKIIDEGRYDNWAYWLIDGKINVVKNNCTVATFQRVGDMFGEMGILQGDARSASVFAAVDTVCIAIDMSILDHADLKHKISQEAFCKDVAFVTKDRLARTTCRLSEAQNELALTRQQLAESQQNWQETLQTLKKTLQKLDEKDREIKALQDELHRLRQEVARLQKP
jgi:CRP-like cAMP-binding protein